MENIKDNVDGDDGNGDATNTRKMTMMRCL